MKRLVFAAIVVAAVVAPGLAGAEPSQYCNGNPTPTVPTSKVTTNGSAVCYAPTGDFKGSINVDRQTGSVWIDNDSGTAHPGSVWGPCGDGYAGVTAVPGNGGSPEVVWSQGGDYNPAGNDKDGGSSATSAGSSHDPFDPINEYGEVIACYAL